LEVEFNNDHLLTVTPVSNISFGDLW